MLIKLPDFDLIGTASTPAEMVSAIKHVERIDGIIERGISNRAVARDPQTKAWYGAAIAETQHELTHVNGELLLKSEWR